MPAVRSLSVEVVHGTAQKQVLLKITVPVGSTIQDAIELSAIKEMFPHEDLGALSIGVWGKPADSDRQLVDGDRIEFYRPLEMDPRDARRQLAAAGKSMGTGDVDRS